MSGIGVGWSPGYQSAGERPRIWVPVKVRSVSGKLEDLPILCWTGRTRPRWDAIGPIRSPSLHQCLAIGRLLTLGTQYANNKHGNRQKDNKTNDFPHDTNLLECLPKRPDPPLRKRRRVENGPAPPGSALFGWLRLARICASRLNRARRSGSAAKASGRIFSATSRLSCVSVACQTCPMPPSPEEGGHVVVPEAGAGGQGHGGLDAGQLYLDSGLGRDVGGPVPESFRDTCLVPTPPPSPERSEAKVASAGSGFLGRPQRR